MKERHEKRSRNSMGKNGFMLPPLICCDRFEINQAKSLSVRRQNSSALQGRWPAGPEGFPMHKSNFSPFSDPFMLSVDASGVVPVGVRPPPPLRGSSPCEAGQFFMAIRMVKKGSLRPPPHGEQKKRYVPRRIY